MPGSAIPNSSFLALSLLQRARGGRISFDEYHHGEGTQAGGASAIFDGPVGLATVLIGFVVLLAIALNGRRLGKPAQEGGDALVPSAGAYVSAMGQPRAQPYNAARSRHATRTSSNAGSVARQVWTGISMTRRSVPASR